MTGDAEQAYHKVHVVSEASQQITQRVNDVATAIEEFSASIREISRNTSEVSDIANTAVNLTNSTNTTIAALETQSQEVWQYYASDRRDYTTNESFGIKCDD